jgi:hypothetical protein
MNQADEATLIARIRELSADSLESAIERGYLLKELGLKWHEYKAKRVGISYQTAYKLITLVDHERMGRNDWTKPRQWTACYELLCANEKVFEAMRKQSLMATTPRPDRFVHLRRRSGENTLQLFHQRNWPSQSGRRKATKHF